MKRILLTLGIFVALVVLVGFVLIVTGAYNVAATETEGYFTRWVMSATMEHSVKRQSSKIVVPNLQDSVLIRLGFEHYNEMCVTCHGSPLGGRSEAGMGLNPPAPDLSEAVKDWSPAELYWIIKNGIKMTGMPGFGPTHDEHELWALVAFVRKLPEMTPEGYRAYSFGEASDTQSTMEHNGQPHDHHAEDRGK